jgi:hypothetical protein
MKETQRVIQGVSFSLVEIDEYSPEYGNYLTIGEKMIENVIKYTKKWLEICDPIKYPNDYENLKRKINFITNYNWEPYLKLNYQIAKTKGMDPVALLCFTKQECDFDLKKQSKRGVRGPLQNTEKTTKEIMEAKMEEQNLPKPSYSQWRKIIWDIRHNPLDSLVIGAENVFAKLNRAKKIISSDKNTYPLAGAFHNAGVTGTLRGLSYEGIYYWYSLKINIPRIKAGKPWIDVYPNHKEIAKIKWQQFAEKHLTDA